jgi:hypothetical protein
MSCTVLVPLVALAVFSIFLCTHSCAVMALLLVPSLLSLYSILLLILADTVSAVGRKEPLRKSSANGSSAVGLNCSAPCFALLVLALLLLAVLLLLLLLLSLLQLLWWLVLVLGIRWCSIMSAACSHVAHSADSIML